MDKEQKEYLDAKTEEFKGHGGILYEEFQKRMDLVIEGHEILDRKIDEIKEEISFELKEIRARS